MAWSACNSQEKLRTELEGFILRWFADSSYKSRLPRRKISIVQQGEKQPAGIVIVIVIRSSNEPTWTYSPQTGVNAGRTITEEQFNIGLVVRADRRNNGVPSVTAVHSVLRSIFSCLGGSAERDDLISRGIYNLFDSAEAVEVDPGADDAEGTTYHQAMSLVCSTETLVN